MRSRFRSFINDIKSFISFIKYIVYFLYICTFIAIIYKSKWEDMSELLYMFFITIVIFNLKRLILIFKRIIMHFVRIKKSNERLERENERIADLENNGIPVLSSSDFYLGDARLHYY